jgi:glycosyltransferase involved in cell wall biosynthesis
VLTGVVVAGQLAILAVSLYQTAITVLGLVRYGRLDRHGHAADGGPAPRLALLVCARDERDVVGALVRDLRAQVYPADRVRVLVVAHNCTDDTAAVASAAGAEVTELHTDALGKGRALIAGFRRLAGERPAPDLVAVFDADARVPADFLRRVVPHLADDDCVQVESHALPAPGWLGRDHGLAREARAVFWWRPREALGLGTTINGSGYFLRPEAAALVLPGLRTLTEELEMTARLYARGRRVAYLSRARLALEEPDLIGPAFQQRSRWVRGHLAVLCREWPRVALRACRGDLRAFDAALHMLVPTRLITRAGATLALAGYALDEPFALPWPLVATGVLTEWVAPFGIAVWQGLIPADLRGFGYAARRAAVSLLWFPVGFWSLVTVRRPRWRPVTRRGPMPAHGHAPAESGGDRSR